MEHQEIYEWLKELAFKNCDKENREQIFWFFEDILEDEIKVEKQKEEIERLNKSFDNLEQVIRYYVLGNSKYDDVTSEYILNRLLQFRTKGSDKE